MMTRSGWCGSFSWDPCYPDPRARAHPGEEATMLRFAYALGMGYLLVCGLALAHRREDSAPRQMLYFPPAEQVAPPAPPPAEVEYVDQPLAQPPRRAVPSTAWFDTIR